MNTALARIHTVQMIPVDDVFQLEVGWEDIDSGTRAVSSIYSANPANAKAAIVRLDDYRRQRTEIQPRLIDNALHVAAHPRDLTQLRAWPYTHQVAGIEAILKWPYFALFDEMGAGKTKQTIDAAQFLYYHDIIDRVIVIAPATVRSVWFNREFGELAKHLWDCTPARVIEWHQKDTEWGVAPGKSRRMEWIITNYDFIRAKERVRQIKQYCGTKTLLVLDESAYVKNHKAQQTKSCLDIRNACGRVLLLNGTPIAHSPLDMYAQGNLMLPSIHGCQTFFQFRARYAIIKRIDTGRVTFPKIIGWQNLDDLQRRFAPYVLRRLKKDCLDLPEKLPPVNLTVNLSEQSWGIYKEMRDELCVWLDRNSVTAAAQAPVKTIRLAQILSGFIGGVEDPGVGGPDQVPDWIELFEPEPVQAPYAESDNGIRWIGREKLDLFLEWVAQRLEEDDTFKLITWCRFKPELFRTLNALRGDTRFLRAAIEGLHGGQKKAEREYAMSLLHPDSSPKDRPALVLGTKGTGGVGTQMHAAHTVFGLSDDFSYYKSKQSDDRVHRPGQTHAVSYFNCIAEGPKGQKTLDHLIARVREGHENIAELSTAQWIRHLRDE